MIDLIPKPLKYEVRYGEFFINNDTKIFIDKNAEFALLSLKELLQKHCNFDIKVVEKKDIASIKFLYDANLGDEEYILDCKIDSLLVRYSSKAGAFYAVQTIRQLCKVDLLNESDQLSMHAVYIEDSPSQKWRGFMMDESRWFFGPTVIKDLLDVMAMLKLNVFHWHLTDNTGWRIEIKKYPKLTEIGSYRRGTQNLAWGKPDFIDNTPHEGFYKQDEIIDIVEYAKARNIMIVPEVDFPAHLVAAIASYPELSCTNAKIEVSPKHGEFCKIIACAGKDNTYQFIYDIIDELSELFPAPYFHIGGDEAPKDEWKKCSKCQTLIKEKSLADEEELQGYLTNKIAVYLRRKGKRLIGWNEILKAKNLDNSIIAQYWTYIKDKRVNEYLQNGKNVIVSKHQAFYFDMPYMQNNLKNTYNYSHKKYGINSNCSGILGVEAALWTEWVFSVERMQFQIFPRILAFSEVAWTPEEKRNYEDFKKRLNNFLPVLKSMGKIYCPLEFVDSCKIKVPIASHVFVKKNAHFEYKKAQELRKNKIKI